MENNPGVALPLSQQPCSSMVPPGAQEPRASGGHVEESPVRQAAPGDVLPAQVPPQTLVQSQTQVPASMSRYSSPSTSQRFTAARRVDDVPSSERVTRQGRDDKKTPGAPVRTLVNEALNDPRVANFLMERMNGGPAVAPDQLLTPPRMSTLTGAASEKKKPSTTKVTKVPRHLGLNPQARPVTQDSPVQPAPLAETRVHTQPPASHQEPAATTLAHETRIDIRPNPDDVLVAPAVPNGIHPPAGDPPPLTWQALCARHHGHEGAAIRANHQVRYGPQERFPALDILFTAAQEATQPSDNNPLPLPRGFLDKLFKAYLSGTTWWGRRLNPDELVQTLTALLELRVRPDKLQVTIRNSRLSTNVRTQAVVNAVYWPGWGLSSYMGAVMLRKGIDPNLSLLILAFMIATLGEFGVAVVRHGGVGPVHTADMVRRRTDEGDRMVRFDSTEEGFFVRGMAFLPFVLTLWYITYSIHDDDPTEQSAQRSYMRFILNGVIATPLVGVWLANAGIALGHNQVNFLPRSVDDQHRLEGTMDSLTGTRLLNPRCLAGDILRGIGGALWSPQDPNAPFLKKVRSSLPQATTRVRWLARFAGAYVLLTMRPILVKAFAHTHPDFGHYAADFLIALAWGFVLETGSRTVSSVEPSRQREAQLNARLQNRRHEEMKNRGQEVLAFRVQPKGVAPRRT